MRPRCRATTDVGRIVAKFVGCNVPRGASGEVVAVLRDRRNAAFRGAGVAVSRVSGRGMHAGFNRGAARPGSRAATAKGELKIAKGNMQFRLLLILMLLVSGTGCAQLDRANEQTKQFFDRLS